MTFLSISFTIIFFVFFLLYYSAFIKNHMILLLIGSCLFYISYIPLHLPIILLLILVNYSFGVKYHGLSNTEQKNFYRIVVSINVLVLVFYKGINSLLLHFWNAQGPLFDIHHSNVETLLTMPLGLSFFVFSSLSYLIDVKRNTIQPEKNLLHLSTSFLYFPKIIQGPIERTGDFISVLRARHVIDPQNIYDGLKLILWGLFKKVVIADRIGIGVSQIFDHPNNHNGYQFILAIFMFSIQLYADFSGFMDIARGISKLLGIELSPNFNKPYLARSIQDFWNRWHMTLSRWLRDYIFLPVSFIVSRNLKKNTYLGIKTEQWIYAAAAICTFVICGLWHGSGWNFLIWGLLFSTFLIFSRATIRVRKRNPLLKKFRSFEKMNNIMSIFWTLTLVSFTWIFFRADSLSTSISILKMIFLSLVDLVSSPISSTLTHLKQALSPADIGLLPKDWYLLLFVIPVMCMVEIFSGSNDIDNFFGKKPLMVRWSLYYLLIFIIAYYGVFSDRQFIYAQF